MRLFGVFRFMWYIIKFYWINMRMFIVWKDKYYIINFKGKICNFVFLETYTLNVFT